MAFVGGVYLFGAGVTFGLVWGGSWKEAPRGLGLATVWPLLAVLWVWDRLDDLRELR